MNKPNSVVLACFSFVSVATSLLGLLAAYIRELLLSLLFLLVSLGVIFVMYRYYNSFSHEVQK